MSDKPITKCELAAQMARLCKVPRYKAAQMIETLLDLIIEGVRTTGKVGLDNFGAFEIRWHKDTQLKHWKMGDFTMPGYYYISFIPSRHTKARIKMAKDVRPIKTQKEKKLFHQSPAYMDWRQNMRDRLALRKKELNG